MKKLSPVEKILGYSFTHQDLLVQALTHRSHGPLHNERMEYLGDALLNCIITTLLYHRFPDAREGELTRLRAQLVGGQCLAQLGTTLQLAQHMFLGRGQQTTTQHPERSILANVVEAVIGAIYLDNGWSACEKWVTHHWESLLPTHIHANDTKDDKTTLQEFSQQHFKTLPTYTLKHTTGPDHHQHFTVTCHINGLKYQSTGTGSSKRAAEQHAASALLAVLTNPDTQPPTS